MNKMLLISVFLTAICSAFYTVQTFSEALPVHFPGPVYDFDKNPIQEGKVTLGRALFYDPVLSLDSTISCASCHSPYNAFAHTDHALSHGINDHIGTRNAPPLFNLAWHRSFMWDGAINHLDMQALAPIHHPKEMGEDIENVVKKLARIPRYQKAFEAAFQDKEITGEYVLKALSQFQLTLVSATAKYDSVMLGTSAFTSQEIEGYTLFQKHCNSCHTEPLFSNLGFASNGLPVDTTLHDAGRVIFSAQKADSFLFKVPSLRNIEYSYPYMHDGRFPNLRAVLKHYTKGDISHKNKPKSLKSNIPLSNREQTDLVAFLKTLSDKAFIFDKKHQFPRNFFFGSKE
ncbi:MAG: cytochrome-c peroxidase [Bacteroidia bacterium]